VGARMLVRGAVASCGLAAVIAAAGVVTASASSAYVTLPGSAPAWAAKAAVRHASPSGRVSVRVYLSPRGGIAKLKAAVTAVATPGSATYRHFLTPAQYRAKYEPSKASAAAVSKWLRSAGMRVTGVEPSRRYVSATGSVAAAERAFGRQLSIYRHNGMLVRAPVGNARVPKAVAGSVLGVTGLDTEPALSKPMLTGPPPAFENAHPCSLYYGQIKARFQGDYSTPLPKFKGATRDYAACGYTPSQFRSAYGVSASGLTGAGETIGIVDAYAAGTMLKDANTYSKLQGDAPFKAGQYSQVLPSSFTHQALCGPQGWAGEETLDVEASHGMAPGAKVVFYAAKSCENSDLEGALAKMDDQNKVTVVSNSYGGVESQETTGDIAAEEQVVLQGEMQGISFLFSSGDEGDELLDSGLRQADYPASDPFVTGVGGTSTAIGATGNLAWETGWGTHKFNLSANGKSWQPYATPSFLYGSGGGFSALFPRPAYQQSAISGGAPSGRAVPDVAMDADPTTGMLVGETQAFPHGVRYGQYRIGGTSLASPLMAGMVADAAQHAAGRLGFLNIAIYKLEAAHIGAFNDVTSVHHGDGNVRPDFVNGVNGADGIVYSVRTFDQDSSLVTRPGWDDVTGVGSPNSVFLTVFGSGGA
jgi:subtilase family serine protease